MAQGLLQVLRVQPRPHHEDLQGVQQDALLQHVSTPTHTRGLGVEWVHATQTQPVAMAMGTASNVPRV